MAAGTVENRALPQGTSSPDRAASVPDIATVYAVHFRYVWRCLKSLGVRDAVLDDALQDVFVVVQKKLGSFDGRVELRTWLYAIAVRVARRYRSRSSREPARLDEAFALSEHAAPGDLEGSLQSNQELLLARAALEALDQEKREVFVLARVEQMSAPEIAQVVGVPVNTVYSRLRAARQAFEAEVARLQCRRKKSP